MISGNIDTLKAQTRQKNKELLDTQNQLEAARTDESEQYESMKVRIRYMYQNSGIGYLEALLESGSFAKMLKQVDYMSTMMQYDRAKLEEYQQTQALIQNAEETIRKDKADLEALQAQLGRGAKQAVNLLMQEKRLSCLVCVRESLRRNRMLSSISRRLRQKIS
ncbi:MAG: coiled-coil domain-containing protein [Eubacterium sp.]